MNFLERPEFFFQLFQSIPDPAVILDHQDRVVQVNQEFTRVFGYAQPDVTGRSINSLVVPRELENEGEQFSHQVLSGNRLYAETMRCTSTGVCIPVAISSSPIYLDGSQAAVFVMYRDISAIREANREREILLDTVDTHIWYLRDPGTYGTMNAAHARYHGRTVEQMSNRPLAEFFGEQYAGQVAQWNEANFVSPQRETVERWVTRHDGVRRLFRIIKTPVVRPDGTVERVVCSGEDITEAWEQQNQLRLLSYMVEHSSTPMMRMDTEYRICYMNGAAEKQYGWTQEELTGKSPGVLNAEENAPEIQEDIRATLARGESWSGRLRNRRKDGSVFTASIFVAPITGHNGELIGYVDVSHDVSQEQSELEYRELLLREIHHRVKNNLATVVSLLSLQAAGVEDPAALAALTQASSRIEAMLTVYESLNESESYRQIQLPVYLRDLMARIQETTRGSTIRFLEEVDQLPVENSAAVSLGMIVNELVTNADKYAYPPQPVRNCRRSIAGDRCAALCAGALQRALLHHFRCRPRHGTPGWRVGYRGGNHYHLGAGAHSGAEPGAEAQRHPGRGHPGGHNLHSHHTHGRIGVKYLPRTDNCVRF